MLTGQDKGAVQIMSNYGFTALKNPGAGWSWGSKNYGVQGTPTSFLLGPNGKVLFRFGGLESLDAVKTCDEEVGGLLAFDAASTATSARAAVESHP